MIGSLLIANRGEIACRVIRTARALGIRTVAVYSDADANALHVRQADEAVNIGPSPARESYLVGDRIIAAALETGAEAIHPGYGFLSENADFAQGVIDAGLVWVGPKPASIRAMGLKDAAKKLMGAAGVPTTPGYLGDDQSPTRLHAEADAIGYPVLIKAVAGGGGKGMRQVAASEDFLDALQSCRREAASSFGDDRVLLERYILSPRHIEVQVFGDTHGNIVHLFERDCSLQRRHQKVIEEAPAPGMDAATRDAVCAAAVAAARAVDYEGAGTIEFIADASEGLRPDRIWFMEMNTRLQVEHPVTEEITGQDLVEWQLRVACGEPLPKRQDELSINGWAMEARLYAEDPAKGFLPSSGPLTYLRLSQPDIEVPWIPAQIADKKYIRVETGVEQGSDVTPFYDPMIAKLIVHASTRLDAAEALAQVCGRVQVWPVRTNAAFLTSLAESSAFRSAAIDTGLIAREIDALTSGNTISSELASTAISVLRQRSSPDQARDWPIGAGLDGFRLNAEPRTNATIFMDGCPVATPLPIGNPWAKDDFLAQGFIFEGEVAIVFGRGAAHAATLAYRPSTTTSTAADGAILSPMPGRIIAVEVAAGDAVAKGQRLVTLEAMKMEHSLVAPFDGTIADLSATPGSQVSEGALLVRVERSE